MAHRSHSQLLATHLLGEDVLQLVARLRRDERSWDYIARQIDRRTNGQVRLTASAVRKWAERSEADEPAQVSA